MASTITLSGDSNRGTQLGINSGHIVNNYSQPVEGSSIKPKPSSTVPFRRDPDFVDRKILTEVDKICSKPASRAALVGLGGVGKSQLAIEYSYRVREQFPQTWIFWVHASNAARFEEGYRLIAEKIELPRRDEPNANILQLVSNWLSDEANGRWMIILDNADDSAVFLDPRNGGTTSGVHAAASLSTFLPQTPNGSVLVTSRSEDAAFTLTGRYPDIIKVEPMNEKDALLLLEKKIRGEFHKSDATELLRALDYMPLAIIQAAAYISQGSPWTTVAEYTEIFHQSDENQMSLLNRHPGDVRRDREAVNSIVTTWQISFEYIRATRPSAARLLSLMSFFDRQGIPEFLLYRYDDEEDGSSIEPDELKDDSHLMFKYDVLTLISYSLIKANNVTDKKFEMHRLVQLSTRKWLQLNSELEKWKKRYIGIMLRVFPEADYENWKVCQVLFPHAEAVLAYRPDETEYLLYWSWILVKAGWYATTQGKFLKAEMISRRALEETEKTLGKEDPITLTIVEFLAFVLSKQGKYKAVEVLSWRALDGYEKTRGKEHPKTLVALKNLAIVLSEQGKYEAAEDVCRQALDRSEKILSKECSNSAFKAIINSLAMVLLLQKKYEAVEELYRQALDELEKSVGKEHPETLTFVSKLATVLLDQGKYEAAEELGQRALDWKEKTLGKEHPDTLETVKILAMMLMKQGKNEAAEELSRRALDGSEETLGKEHPNTLAAVSLMATTLSMQGKDEAAEELHRRALDVSKKTLGKEHPNTLKTANIPAMAPSVQGKHEAAENLDRRVPDAREKTLGKEHLGTLETVQNLAAFLSVQEKHEAAEGLSQRALDGNEKKLGKEHPKKLTTVNNLAGVLRGQGKYEAAEELHRRALEGNEKTLGKGHPYTLKSVNNLAMVLSEQGKYEAAEELSRGALDENEKTLGKEHPNTLKTVENIAFLLMMQGKYAAAEELLRRVLDGSEKTLRKEHPDTLAAVSLMATVLSMQGKYKAAEELHRRALDGREKAMGKEHHDTLTSAYMVAIALHQQKKYQEATTLYERACAGFRKVLGPDHPETLTCSMNYASMTEKMDSALCRTVESVQEGNTIGPGVMKNRKRKKKKKKKRTKKEKSTSEQM